MGRRVPLPAARLRAWRRVAPLGTIGCGAGRARPGERHRARPSLVGAARGGDGRRRLCRRAADIRHPRRAHRRGNPRLRAARGTRGSLREGRFGGLVRRQPGRPRRRPPVAVVGPTRRRHRSRRGARTQHEAPREPPAGRAARALGITPARGPPPVGGLGPAHHRARRRSLEPVRPGLPGDNDRNVAVARANAQGGAVGRARHGRTRLAVLPRRRPPPRRGAGARLALPAGPRPRRGEAWTDTLDRPHGVDPPRRDCDPGTPVRALLPARAAGPGGARRRPVGRGDRSGCKDTASPRARHRRGGARARRGPDVDEHHPGAPALARGHARPGERVDREEPLARCACRRLRRSVAVDAFRLSRPARTRQAP